MDMGSAYGGCARAMVKKFGCDVSLRPSTCPPSRPPTAFSKPEPDAR